MDCARARRTCCLATVLVRVDMIPDPIRNCLFSNNQGLLEPIHDPNLPRYLSAIIGSGTEDSRHTPVSMESSQRSDGLRFMDAIHVDTPCKFAFSNYLSVIR